MKCILFHAQNNDLHSNQNFLHSFVVIVSCDSFRSSKTFSSRTLNCRHVFQTAFLTTLMACCFRKKTQSALLHLSACNHKPAQNRLFICQQDSLKNMRARRENCRTFRSCSIQKQHSHSHTCRALAAAAYHIHSHQSHDKHSRPQHIEHTPACARPSHVCKLHLEHTGKTKKYIYI